MRDWTRFPKVVVPASVATAGTCLLLWYYSRNKHSPPWLHHVVSDLHSYIVNSKPRFTSDFRPPFWLQNKHLQTLASLLLPKYKVSFKREYLDLKDQGVLALDWVMNNSEELLESSTVLIVLPGLTAGREDVGHLCRLAAKKGYRVVVFNKRGHGDSKLTTPKLQSFGDTDDLRQVVEYLRDKFPAKIVAVSSSAGSGLLVSLGDFGSDCVLSTGVCISPGYDTRDLFLKHMSGVYEYLLLSNLKLLLRRHAKILSSTIDLDAACRSSTFRDFDTHVYCRLYGHSDIEEYWKHNNPMRNIRNVAVPVMCINSLDDPICVAQNIPFDMFSEKSDWLLVTTDKGGHCGFFEGCRMQSWSDKLALDYIDAVLEYQAHQGAPEAHT